VEQNPELIKEVLRYSVTKSDIIALGYRKEQLEIFRSLLEDHQNFRAYMIEYGKSSVEATWQDFFERNKWVFGYGLNYISMDALEGQKLEQVVSGYDFSSSGKRVDALMKTKGIVSSLCFVEIKTHSTPLIAPKADPYRAECWPISTDLAGSVAQIQKTVQKAVASISTRIRTKDKDGSPSSEELFLYQPRSFVVIGCLDEFVTENGINEDKYSSFELFRRGLANPEILTFDELYERAKFIVNNSEQ
jgi:hypothetical protein